MIVPKYVCYESTLHRFLASLVLILEDAFHSDQHFLAKVVLDIFGVARCHLNGLVKLSPYHTQAANSGRLLLLFNYLLITNVPLSQEERQDIGILPATPPILGQPVYSACPTFSFKKNYTEFLFQ